MSRGESIILRWQTKASAVVIFVIAYENNLLFGTFDKEKPVKIRSDAFDNPLFVGVSTMCRWLSGARQSLCLKLRMCDDDVGINTFHTTYV